METQTAPTLAAEVLDIFGDQERVGVCFASSELYQRFRSLESGLISCVDGESGENKRRLQVLAIEVDGEAVGVVSYIVSTNAYRQSSLDLYGRIDLVIMARHLRGLGIGRLLVLSSITQLLAVYGRRLYSLSSLAAHPAMESILEEVGFGGEYRQNDNFKHEELRFDDLDVEGYLDSIILKSKEALGLTNYRLRQGQQRV